MSNIAVYPLATGTGIAAEWTTEAGTEIQAVGLKGAGMLFGARRPGGDWALTTFTMPERYGTWETVPQMRAWAEAFVNAAMNGD
jgi:hypothetical protein